MRAAASDALDKFDAIVLSKTDDRRDVGGVSIYFPGPETPIDTNYLSEFASLLASTGWGDFIQRFHSSSSATVMAVQADWAENNPGFSRAYNLGTLMGSGNRWTDLSLHSGTDVDWYRFQLQSNGVAGNAISVATVQPGASLKASLFRADNPSIAIQSLNLTNGVATLSLQLSSGEYLLKVESPVQSAVSNY